MDFSGLLDGIFPESHWRKAVGDQNLKKLTHSGALSLVPTQELEDVPIRMNFGSGLRRYVIRTRTGRVLFVPEDGAGETHEARNGEERFFRLNLADFETLLRAGSGFESPLSSRGPFGDRVTEVASLRILEVTVRWFLISDRRNLRLPGLIPWLTSQTGQRDAAVVTVAGIEPGDLQPNKEGSRLTFAPLPLPGDSWRLDPSLYLRPEFGLSVEMVIPFCKERLLLVDEVVGQVYLDSERIDFDPNSSEFKLIALLSKSPGESLPNDRIFQQMQIKSSQSASEKVREAKDRIEERVEKHFRTLEKIPPALFPDRTLGGRGKLGLLLNPKQVFRFHRAPLQLPR